MGSGELDSKPTRRRWRLHQSAMVVLWVVVSLTIWAGLHCHIRRLIMRKAEEGLVSMCEERARMLQDRFAVSVNHVHALAILVSTFHYQKEPPALDQVY
jgi:arabidopsis histidine kinase 2/3/4 (cytokinin receptor)